MPIFDYSFIVNAPQAEVAAFHANTHALKKLKPPFVILKLHRVDPMDEGSISEFTMWMGLIPVRWRAVHSNVGPSGFTDTQINGPLAYWKHDHRFEVVDENTTQIHEHIEYEFLSGWSGLLSRLLFGLFGLTALFTYRKLATQWALRKRNHHDS